MHVLNFALEMEKVGKEYFEKLAAETSLKGVQKIFHMLAAEQQELIDTFASFELKAVTPRDSQALERAKGAFTQIFNEATVGILRDDLDAYRHALKVESEIVHFFEKVAGLETNLEAKALLMEIAEEEKKIYDVIENIHDFVAVPNTQVEGMDLAT